MLLVDVVRLLYFCSNSRNGNFSQNYQQKKEITKNACLRVFKPSLKMHAPLVHLIEPFRLLERLNLVSGREAGQRCKIINLIF